MSYATLDEVNTMEDIAHGNEQYSLLCKVAEALYIHNHVGQYFLLTTPEKRLYFQSQLKTDDSTHQKILNIIHTFESAEIPEPPVKKKRGRPRKNQG